MRNSLFKFKSYAFVLLLSLSLFSCDSNDDDSLPEVEIADKEKWLDRVNGDIISLRNAVLVVQEEDSITNIQIADNSYVLEFVKNEPVKFILDNVNNPAPLIGIHKIDKKYFWTQIIDTGTSATTLLKDQNRSNYEVSPDGVLPQFEIDNYGNWIINVDNDKRDVYNPEGKKYRAIGVKALFKEISFDTDSNATIITNEVPSREYTLPKYRPFTLVISTSATDTLKMAAGFSIPVDFICSGITSFEFVTPKAWSATYNLSEDKKSGTLIITSPSGMEAEYEEKGSVEVIAINKYGKRLTRKIPVKCEMGLINYASVTFTGKPDDIELLAATFTFTDDNSSVSEKNVSSIKAGNEFRLMLPDGFPILRKITFTTSGVASDNTFTYYLPPTYNLTIGNQDVSITPPQLLSYWQGGLILKINEAQPLTGISRYNITGTIMGLTIGPKLPWYPNGNVDITGANSDSDGGANTAAIIAIYGPPNQAGTNLNIAARWAAWVSFGGHTDWYLPAEDEMLLFCTIWAADKELMKQTVEKYGGTPLIEGTHSTFWTSTNINKTQAKMLDTRTKSVSPGTKVYGCWTMAFREFK